MKKFSEHELRESNGKANNLDLICLSHLRWNFVYQRPQHLLSRAAKQQRVFFFEEPIFQEKEPHLEIKRGEDGVYVAVPQLPHGMADHEQAQALKLLLDEMIHSHSIEQYITWYYTPMALKFSRHLRPVVSVYDCMDQLSHFKGAPKEIPLLEQELFNKVDLVFTGGHSLYEAKRDSHPSVHAFPSSVDVTHFIKARAGLKDPEDQAPISGPRIGYVGVIDERVDIELIDSIAAMRPDWQIVMVGPVVKIDPASLPRRPNIHYLGGKNYEQLPSYLSGWDIAILPFARNDATRYISPTKTPEYLSAGKRVISTSIRDVVRPYGEKHLVAIADDAEQFVRCAEEALASSHDYTNWLSRVDSFLSSQSWDMTFTAMWTLIDQCQKATEKSYQARKVVKPALSARLGSEISIPSTVVASGAALGGKIAMAPG